MKQILFITLCFVNVFLFSQVNPTGNPLTTNFSPLEYKAAEQNWSITQDNRGVIYVGNHAGVLEYDGNTWNMIHVDNNSAVRSINVDDNGRVYIGAVGEIGYLAPDKEGKMNYNSLLEKTDTNYHNFSEVWKAYSHKNKVHFSTRVGFYVYDYEQDTVIVHQYDRDFRNSIYPLFTFQLEEDIYLGTYINGLMKYNPEIEDFETLPGGNVFEWKNIFSIINYDNDNILVCTDESGVYLYNKNTHVVDSTFFLQETQNLLINNYLYHAVNLPYNRFGFATDEGVIITDKNGNIEYILNNDNGLQDKTAYSLFHDSNDKDAPIWIALNNGIAYTHVFNPIKRFAENSGFDGLIMDMVIFEDYLFLATSSGVYYLNTYNNKQPGFIKIDNINTLTYSMDVWKDHATGKKKLLAATRGDVFEIDGNFIARSITAQIENKTHNAFVVFTSNHYPGRIYLGLNSGLEIIEYVNGKWQNIDYKDEYSYEISSIVEEDNGNIWVASRLVGYARVEFDGYDASFYKYNTENGLPENLNWLKLFNYNNKILFLTSRGVYNFDKDREIFKLDKEFCKEEDPAGYFAFDNDDEGNIWMSRYIGQQQTWIENALRNNDGTFDFISNPFSIIPSLWCDAILSDNNVAWLGISNQLYSYDNDVEKNYKQVFNTLIRRVSTLGDSLLFAGTFYEINDRGDFIVSQYQPEDLKPVLSYSFNNLEVNFSATYFEGRDDIQYSYKLDGFDEWSRWTNETKAVYSYIPVGSYNFMVKARNVYGQEGIPASFSLVVLPPWYRTIWAYIAYGIMAILAVYVIIILNTRRLKREKEILEGIVKERTAEVVKQKEEIEKQNDNIRNSIEYAKRIQTAALPPDDFIDRLIPERFILFMPRDIVSGDFYWIGRMGDKVVAVAADCTGHGVPGGFMSMLGISYLNQIVSSNNEYSASQVLDNLREQVMKSLRQKDEASESRDGMDISLVIFHQNKNIIEFAGANNPLYIIRNGEIIEAPCDKMPIGIHRRADRNFTNHMVEVEKNDMLILFSDGYKDQFGGPDGRKFMSKNFKQILIDVHQKPVEKQKEILEKTIVDWTGNYDRIDDVIVMGIRVQ